MIKSYTRDSTHIINKLNDITDQAPNAVLCTLDVSSLNTNIPHEEGIKTILEALAIHRSHTKIPHNSFLVDLLTTVLENNYFDFNGRHFHQIAGTAMETMLAPIYANLFMSHFEDKYVYTYPLQPFLWKRCLDDIFLIWIYFLEELNDFINDLNECHSTIKFTQEVSVDETLF